MEVVTNSPILYEIFLHGMLGLFDDSKFLDNGRINMGKDLTISMEKAPPFEKFRHEGSNISIMIRFNVYKMRIKHLGRSGRGR
jgi:hypothetical protein